MEDRVAIVTGASSGIGAAAARMLAEAGVRTVLTYAGNADGAEAAAADCRAAGAEALTIQADAGSDADCLAVAEAARTAWGRIDILINNGGTTVSAPMDRLDALSAEDFQSLYQVNVVGAFQMVRACETELRASEQGSVIMTSSVSSIAAGVGSSMAYTASKGAMNTLTLQLARALAPAVRVNAVLPGFVDSAWWARRHQADEIEKMRQGAARRAVLRRYSPPEEIAEAMMLFALGGRSITGQLLVVDNGMSLNIGQPLA